MTYLELPRTDLCGTELVALMKTARHNEQCQNSSPEFQKKGSGWLDTGGRWPLPCGSPYPCSEISTQEFWRHMSGSMLTMQKHSLILLRRESLIFWIPKKMFWQWHCVWKHLKYFSEVPLGRHHDMSVRNEDPQTRLELLADEMSVKGGLSISLWMGIKGRFCSSGIQQAYLKHTACAWPSACAPRGNPRQDMEGKMPWELWGAWQVSWWWTECLYVAAQLFVSSILTVPQ